MDKNLWKQWFWRNNSIRLALDSNGNIYIGNSFPGTFDGLTFNCLGQDFIIKFDSSKSSLDFSSGSTSVNHTTGGIILDNAGNVITAGARVYAPSINSVTNNSWSDQGLLLQKFNSNTGAYISTTLISAGTNRGK